MCNFFLFFRMSGTVLTTHFLYQLSTIRLQSVVCLFHCANNLFLQNTFFHLYCNALFQALNLSDESIAAIKSILFRKLSIETNLKLPSGHLYCLKIVILTLLKDFILLMQGKSS